MLHFKVNYVAQDFDDANLFKTSLECLCHHVDTPYHVLYEKILRLSGIVESVNVLL